MRPDGEAGPGAMAAGDPPPTRRKADHSQRFDLLAAWLMIAAAELVISRPLLNDPSISSAGLHVATLVALGLLHQVAGRLVPRRALAAPWAPALLYGLAATSFLFAAVGAPLLAVPSVPIGVALLCILRHRQSPSRWAPWYAAAAAVLATAVVLQLRARWAHEILAQPIDDAIAWAAPVALVVVGALATLARRWPAAALGAAALLLPVLGLPLRSLLPETEQPAAGLSSASRPDVILITVDTLRRDEAERMGTYRRLAAKGQRFSDALAPSPWTLPSLASLHTGLWPHRHHARRDGRNVDRIATHGMTASDRRLAEAFRAAGYRTSAVVANPFISRAAGFAQGFDEFLHPRETLPGLLAPTVLGLRGHGLQIDLTLDDADRQVARAATLISRHGSRPLFLWLHLVDPHLPYVHAVDSEDAWARAYAHDLRVERVRAGLVPITPSVEASIRRAYGAEVAHVDRALGRLLDGIERRPGPTPIIAFTSDHGEEFWEHGGFEHGHAIVPEVVEIPLVIVGEHFDSGTSRDDPVSLVDLAPTLLAAAGIAAAAATSQADHRDGLDLRMRVHADRGRRIEEMLYGPPQEALIAKGWVLRRRIGMPDALFGTRDDPGWHRDLARQDPERRLRMARRLWILGGDGTMANGDGRPVPEGSDPTIDDAAGLRALGYIE